jgi:predicted RNase H-like HicB family nuclease
MNTYVAFIRKTAGTEYGVEFPDFPGCITAGESLDEALANAAEALAGHIAVMRENDEPIPEPSDLDDAMRDRRNRGAIAVLIQAGPEPTRAVRVNVTIDEGLLAEIDRAAQRARTSRSGFLADAARAALYGRTRKAG